MSELTFDVRSDWLEIARQYRRDWLEDHPWVSAGPLAWRRRYRNTDDLRWRMSSDVAAHLLGPSGYLYGIPVVVDPEMGPNGLIIASGERT